MVFHIADDHFAETFRIFVLRTTQKNDFIAQNGSGILLDIVFRDVVGRIGLEARDKIHTGEIPFIQHGKIDVSAITNHHAVTREFHSSGAVYLMNISIGEINEHGKMTIMIQQHIELDCPFGLPIGCPWKNFNAKLNQRCVETVKSLGKRKLMPWRNCMAVSQKHMENITEHFRRAMGIGVRQVGFSGSGFHTKMIQLASAGFQTSANLSQTIGLRQLAEDHRHKMCPTVKGLFSLVSIVFHDYFFKFSLRYQIQHLTKKTD